MRCPDDALALRRASASAKRSSTDRFASFTWMALRLP
jgi:hypothetical protein